MVQTDKYANEHDEKMRIIEAASAIIQEDILSEVFDLLYFFHLYTINKLAEYKEILNRL